MGSSGRPTTWKILIAFATIYFVWGSTFLAIRVGVREVPPFLLAAMRFTVAGVVLYAWMRLKGVKGPTAREWRSASLLGAIIFLVDYGALFWAEQRVPSGIAAVVLATIPVFIAILDIVFLRTHRLTVRLAGALLVGLAGVAVLMNNSMSLGEAPIDRMGALALLVASFSWSVATILTRKLPLPSSKAMSSAAQMLTGGVQLFVVAALVGETKGFRASAVSTETWLALLYLIIAGSLAGFTAYVWLLHYESPTKVGTYAYVNPVVAVAIGYIFGGETVGPRTLLGTALVLISVLVINLGSKLAKSPNSDARDDAPRPFARPEIEEAR
jgi:drug/metabolite transporter (DMT)-like permease